MTFVNELAAERINAELEFKAAAHMQKRYAPPDQIYEQTGVAIGPDGMGRKEISDRGFRFKDEFLATGGPMRLADAVEHDEYFNAIPSAADVTIAIEPELDARGAYFDQFDLILLKKPNEETALHEMQHVAQDHLNFPAESRGTSPQAAGSYKAYYNNNGEIEARETGSSRGADWFDDAPDLLKKTIEEHGDRAPPYRPPGMGA